MSSSVFVFFFLIDPSETPSHLSSWEDAEDVISDRWNKREQAGNTQGYVLSASRNGWHQHLLHLICQAYGIQGLEFTAREIACLQKQGLLAGIAGLNRLFQIIQSQRLLDKLEMFELYSDILDQAYLAALHQAQIASEIEPYDTGFEAAVSFFTFLKSLKAVIETAYQADKFLLYVMPAFNEVGGSIDALKSCG